MAKKSVKPSYAFEFELALVQRFLAGEDAMALADEAQLSSATLLKTWARAYRRDGEDALRPKPKGRQPAPVSGGRVGVGSAATRERVPAGPECLLRKIAGLDGAATTVKVNAVVTLKAEHSLTDLLRAASFPRSTFSYHQSRRTRPDEQATLQAEIRRIFDRFGGRYGHRRIHDSVRRSGWMVSKKTVLKLMRHLGLRCLIRRKRHASFRGEVGKVASNLLKRDFTTTRPNQKWVTDVTEFRAGDRKVYLSTVMDLFGREIIGHTVGISPNLELTNGSLRQALTRLTSAERPIVHSDQGLQYQHATWQLLLREAGATGSMWRMGNCLDNAVMKSFFGHLKDELYCNTTFPTVDALTTAINTYIAWFNTERAHSTLKGLSPVQYRTQTPPA